MPLAPPAEPVDSGPFLHPALSDLLGHLAWRAAARVQAALAEVMPPDVDIHGYAALLALVDGRPRSQQELAETISTSRTTLARLAARLVTAGLVERVRSPADRRSYALTRTEAGAAAVETWRTHADALQERVTSGLSTEERDDLHRLLLRLADPDLSPQAPRELRDSTAFLLTRVHARMHREFQAILEPLAIEPKYVGALIALTATGPVPQAELARLLGVSGAATVQIADALEARGLVERRRDPADRRRQHLHLLPEAPGVLDRARRLAITVPTLASLDPDERARLVGHLRRFVTAP